MLEEFKQRQSMTRAEINQLEKIKGVKKAIEKSNGHPHSVQLKKHLRNLRQELREYRAFQDEYKGAING